MSEAPTPTPKPIACIRSGSIGNYTLCARSVSDKEFLFTDAGYAVMHYDPRGNKLLASQLSACEACCDVVNAKAKDSGPNFGGSDLRKSM